MTSSADVPVAEVGELGIERGGPHRVVGERAVDRDRRAVARLEVVAELGTVAEPVDHEVVAHRLEVVDAVAEQVAHVALGPPERGRLGAGRGWRGVRLHDREHLADEALGGPADQADPPAAAGHPHQLVGGGPVERREHHADAGRRHVERAVGVGQRLGVPLLPRDVEALGRRQPLADDEQLGCQVGCRDAGSRSGRRDGHGARARGDVEEPVAGRHVARLDEHVAERGDDVGGDGRVVAQGPHRAVLLLHLGGGAVADGRVGPALLGGVGHGGSPSWW